MFSTNKQENALIDILSMQKDIQIQQIHEILKKDYDIVISLAQLYKTINKLLDNQIIVKQWKKVSLNLRWIEKVRSFVQSVEKNYLSSLDEFDFDMGNTQTFHADSLFALDTIWNNAIQKMITLSPWEDIYFYDSHPYHILGLPGTEHELMSYLANHQTIYYLFWNIKILDQYGAELLERKWCLSRCHDDTPFLKEWYCNVLVGDYILESIFPNLLTEYFATFFDKVQDISEFNMEQFASIFKIKVTVSFTIKKSPTHVERIRKKIQSFF